MSVRPQHLYEFGPYRLDTGEQLLLRDGKPVPLTPKAFETLVALVERSGHLVEKEELMKLVWADAYVEESNLTNNVAAIRKLLGRGKEGRNYIETVPKRGYRFTPPVRELPRETLVVEKRTLTRVVSEETERDDSPQKPMIGAGEALAIERTPVHTAQRSLWPSLVVASLITSLVIGGFFIYRLLSTAPRNQIESIAVLPFRNESGSPDVEYLSDGVAESLINRLSQLPGVKVISRSSSFQYKGKETNPQEVATTLGVEAILMGRVFQRDNSLHISVELINARDRTQIWGEQYHRQVADALAVQEEIAREISEKLQVKLTAQEHERLVKRHTENIEAYEAYLKGRYFWSNRTVEDINKSIDYFRQAIEKDPRYALAYTGLADSYILLGTYHVLPPAEAIPKARLAAMKALEIDDELAEAHISLATIEGELEWNWSIAEKEFKQAIKLNPNYATAHQWYGEYLVVMGRFDEALAEIKRAHQLDPLSLVVNLALGDVFYYSRRYDEAIEQYRKTVEIDSDFAYAYAWLGRAYLQKGLYAEAIAKLEKARELSGGEPLIVAWLGYAFALTGEKDKARDMLDELKERSKREYISRYYLAIIYAGLADKDQAFEYLEKAYAERSNWMLRLKAEPKFDSLRSDQRFTDLLRRVGLPT